MSTVVVMGRIAYTGSSAFRYLRHRHEKMLLLLVDEIQTMKIADGGLLVTIGIVIITIKHNPFTCTVKAI
jgi:hypothetical protein